MSVASLKVVPEDLKTSIIKVSDYRDRNLRGSFYSAYYGKEIAFDNLTSLLLLMEGMMDEMNCPQATTRTRLFRKTPGYAERASLQKEWVRRPDCEAIATFKVKVLFRQGSSWQGKLYWKEEDKEVSFRSALEMIKLMDSALPQPETAQEPQEETTAHIG